jgi:hypothetical protein
MATADPVYQNGTRLKDDTVGCKKKWELPE